jgi:hypothetical protein
MAWLFFNQHADQVLQRQPQTGLGQRYGGTATARQVQSNLSVGGNGGKLVEHAAQHRSQGDGRLRRRCRFGFQVLAHQPNHSDYAIGLLQGSGDSILRLTGGFFDGEFQGTAQAGQGLA